MSYSYSDIYQSYPNMGYPMAFYMPPNVYREVKHEQNLQPFKVESSKQVEKSTKFEPNHIKNEKNEKMTAKDEQYQPCCSIKKGSIKNFNKGRNSHSNVLRYFFKALRAPSMNRAYELLREKKYPTFRKQVLIQWIEQNNVSYKNYIKMETLIKLIAKSKETGKILYLLFKHYSEKFGRNHLMCSKKLKKQNLEFCLKAIREVQEVLLESYCC